VKVHRREVFEAIEAANREALAPTLAAMSDFASAIKGLPNLPKAKDPQ
jgi:sRNA-binding carbon storage regulator CsrA